MDKNDFDIQLFADGDDPSGEPTAPPETSPISKIKLGESEYSPEELIVIVQNDKKNADWQKANTVKAQELAKERELFAAEREQMKGWLPIMEQYQSNEHFQQGLDTLLAGGTSQEETFADPQVASIYRELSEIKAERAKEKAAWAAQQQREDNKMIEQDRQQIVKAISAGGDIFTYADVEAFAVENEIPLLSVAYEILRGSEANIKHHAKNAAAAALAEYARKAPPRLAPNGNGGGVIGQEKPFVDFRTASQEAAREYKPYG